MTIPADGVARFATQLAPALRNVAPVVSSDESFTMPVVSAPELVLRADHGSDHITTSPGRGGTPSETSGRSLHFTGTAPPRESATSRPNA